MPTRSARRFLPVLLAAIPAVAACIPDSAGTKPPNIVLLLADDMG